jgi:hypothetical protein
MQPAVKKTKIEELEEELKKYRMEYLLNFDSVEEYYIFCIDFESVGGIPHKNAFTQLGACFFKSNGERLSTFETRTNLVGFEKEERCMKEFWEVKMQHELPQLELQYSGKNDYPTPKEAIANLWSWADGVIKEHNIEPGHILKIGDCISYDVMLLGAFSDRDVRNPFGDDMEWIDVSSVYAGMARFPITASLIHLASSKKMAANGLYDMTGLQIVLPRFNVDHTHSPVDDATNITLHFLYFHMMLRNATTGVETCHTDLDKWIVKDQKA